MYGYRQAFKASCDYCKSLLIQLSVGKLFYLKTLKSLIQHLSQSLGEDPHRVNQMLESFANVIRNSATSLSAVAIPSFGTFEAVKYDEEIVNDRVTGKRLLLPPQVVVEFHPAAMLRKRLNKSNE